MSLLKIQNLSIRFRDTLAVSGLNLTLKKGQSVGIVGESGSGKTSILLAIMGLVDKQAQMSGSIRYQKHELTNLDKETYNQLRWKHIALIFQNSHKYLNPKRTIYQHIAESIRKDLHKNSKSIHKDIEQLFQDIELDMKWLHVYPKQLSGGMLQKVLIIMALASKPQLLLIDEPTTALEAVSKNAIVDYLYRLRKQDMTMIVVSHDINVIKKLTDSTIVIYKGEVLEHNPTKQLLESPKHPYTRALLMASHELNPYKDLWGIHILSQEQAPCVYYNSCTQRIEKCLHEKPILNEEGVSCLRGGIVTLLAATNLSKSFKTANHCVAACQNCSLTLQHGEVLSLIGQSGSGKTTLAKLIAGFLSCDSGDIVFNQEEFLKNDMMKNLGGLQMVFQDPYASINPKFSVSEAILEPIHINKIYNEVEAKRQLKKVLQDVGLSVDFSKRASLLSGGQLQRIAIARALIMQPKLLIADEITSSLDISNKVNLLRLLKTLQNQKGFSMIYITHDLAMAQKISDKIAVMNNGKIVEQGLAQDILMKPQHDYTKKLLKANRK